MRKITVRRLPGWYAKVRKAKIKIDGNVLGHLSQDDSITVEISDQAQVLKASVDWGSTRPFPLFDVEDGATIILKFKFTLNPLRNIGIMTLPADLYLDI
ncbi:MAG: hypothetical protein AAF386_09700 [Pseudomonadota bacterium]